MVGVTVKAERLNNMALLEARSLTVEYGGARVLTDASFEVHEGEIVAMLGPNGAGKSTALRAVGGLLSYYDGKLANGHVSFQGKDVTEWTAARLYDSGIAIVAEGRRVFRRMTVRENLEMGSQKKHTRQQLREEINEVLSLFPRLAERSRQLAGSLSTGEQQMLALGRAFISHPKLLLADEPSTGLSPTLVESIMDQLSRIRNAGISILLAEQNVVSTLDVADRAYIFSTGKISVHGTVAELKVSTDAQTAFLGNPSSFTRN